MIELIGVFILVWIFLFTLMRLLDVVFPLPKKSKLVADRYGKRRRVLYQEDGMPLAFWDEDND